MTPFVRNQGLLGRFDAFGDVVSALAIARCEALDPQGFGDLGKPTAAGPRGNHLSSNADFFKDGE